MKKSTVRISFVNAIAVLACMIGSGNLPGVTIQTLGAGSAVFYIDRSATFDALTSTNVVHLENYSEGGLNIITSADSWAADLSSAATLDPFHGAGTGRAFYAIAWGNNDWVTIQSTNLAVMHGVEFLYGNTWTTGSSQYPWGNPNAVLEWQTWSNQSMVSSGTIGPNPMLQMGTIVGFYDPAGFDQLRVRATIPSSGDPTLQALALDNLYVMLTNLPPAPVIYGSNFRVARGTGEATLIVYDTLPQFEYRMVYTETLNPPQWNTASGWQPGGVLLTFSDPGAPGRPQRFYRVEAR